jgi:hypothetical protein
MLPSIFSVPCPHVIDQTKVQRTQRTTQHTQRLLVFAQAVYAHVAFQHSFREIVTQELRRAIGTRREALPVALTSRGVYEYGAVGLFLVDRLMFASIQTTRVLTVEAHDGQGAYVDIREDTLLPLVDPDRLGRSRRDVSILLAGDYASIAPSAPTQVDEEAVLRHHSRASSNF